jgi:radical SAM protein (TIGR01212 family)
VLAVLVTRIIMSMPEDLPAGVCPQRRYRPFSTFLRERFGGRVHRIALDGGFTCPNVDGTVTTGGCVFCDNESFSPNRRIHLKDISAQLARGIAIVGKRFSTQRFLAYFQAGTGTHARIEKLRRLYDQALAEPRVVGLSIATRPDSLPGPILDLLSEYRQRTFVGLEIGLQSMHDRSLAWMNRGHDVACFLDAVERCTGRGFDLCVHVILGLPGESRDDMLATADFLAGLPIDGVKIHNLHVVRDTPMEGMYQRGEVRMLERQEYVELVCDFLERLPARHVLHRLTGDAPPDHLVAPLWCLDKAALLAEISAELVRRGSWQGKTTRPVEQPLRAARRALPLV